MFTGCDDVATDVTGLMEALRRERRICESEELPDSLFLVELLEGRLSDAGLGSAKNLGQTAMVRARYLRGMLVEIFTLGRQRVKELATQLDTIHRLIPSLCQCLHAAYISSAGAPEPPEEWKEFFLERDRLDAENAGMPGDEHKLKFAQFTIGANQEYQALFSVERAIRIATGYRRSDVINAMLDWPSSNSYSSVQHQLAYFFAAFQRLSAAEQEQALPHLREAIFQQLVPEKNYEPWSYYKFRADRWFTRILSLGEKALAMLFGEQNAKEVIALAVRGGDERENQIKQFKVPYGMYNKLPSVAQGLDYLLEQDTHHDERLKSVEEQLNYVLGSERLNWRGESDRDAAHGHMLDLLLNVQENASVYLFDKGNYPICSRYCGLLWDKAVSAILLEQKVRIVESADKQWRWLELMRKLSIIRLRNQHPERSFGWRW